MAGTVPVMRFLHLLAAALALNLAATGQVQLLPAGEFKARDGRPGPGKHWRLSDAAGQQLAAEMNQSIGANHMPIDYDHQTLYVDKTGAKALAAGWITHVAWRAGEGLFATVEWTAAAKAHIEAGEYRYISPVIVADPATGEVRAVFMASLVNVPALQGMEAAVAALAAFKAFNPQEKPDMEFLIQLAALLGMAAGADQAAVLNAVKALMDKAAQPATMPAALATALGIAPGCDEAAALAAVHKLRAPDTTALAAIQALQAEVGTLRGQLEGDKLDKLVADALATGKLLPAMQQWATELGKRDIASLQAYLDKVPAIPGMESQTRGAAAHDAKAGNEALAADPQALAVARQMGIAPAAWAAGLKQAA